MPYDPSEISQSDPVGEVPSADMGFATVDLDRERRTGFPEVVMGQGKTPEHIAEIAERIYGASGMVLVTRSDINGAEAVKAVIPTANFIGTCGAIWADDRGLKSGTRGLSRRVCWNG